MSEERITREIAEARQRCQDTDTPIPTCTFRKSDASGAYLCTNPGCGHRFHAESLEPLRKGLCRNPHFMDAKVAEQHVADAKKQAHSGPTTLADVCDQFRASVRKLARPGVTRVVLTVTDTEMTLEMDHREAETLRRDGISMRDVRGEWIV